MSPTTMQSPLITMWVLLLKERNVIVYKNVRTLEINTLLMYQATHLIRKGQPYSTLYAQESEKKMDTEVA